MSSPSSVCRIKPQIAEPTKRLVGARIAAAGSGVSCAPPPPAFLDCERELAAFEREGLFAEQLAPPAGERRHVGMVVVGDAVEVVHRGDDLAGDPSMALMRRWRSRPVGSVARPA
jgi:hypothetical protein